MKKMPDSSSAFAEISINACLLSLASNYRPEYYLSKVQQCFKQYFDLAEIILSDEIVSQDYQSLTNPLIYHNQIAVLYFNQPILLTRLVDSTKQIENTLDRNNFQKPIITLDIDLIAFASPDNILDSSMVDKIGYQGNSLIWYKVLRRFPLATYDIAGITNLVRQHKLPNIFLKHLIK